MIYVVKQSDYVKIGYTSRFKKRLQQLQVSSPVKLEVLALIKGDKVDERNFHDAFKHISSNNEWFHYNEEIERFVEALDKDLMWKYGLIEEKNSPIGLIKQTRLEKNLSLEEVGEKLGITKQGVMDMERRDAQGRITINTLSKVLYVMNSKLGIRAVDL
jgi:DNA-binding XRE family transcriptional regulator